MCGSRAAASWWTVQPTGNTPVATKSEAATLKLPSMAADVFPTSQTSPEVACARLPHSIFFPPFLNLAISSLACHPSTVQWCQHVGKSVRSCANMLSLKYHIPEHANYRPARVLFSCHAVNRIQYIKRLPLTDFYFIFQFLKLLTLFGF